jgi:maltose-binding protein MalE
MNKKRIGVVGLVTAAALAVSALAVFPAQAASNRTIIIWADDERGPALKKFIEAKNAALQGYTVKVTTYASYDALDSAWKKASAASAPDIMFHPVGEAITAAKSGRALPIILTATAKSNFSTTALKYGQYQGRQYGLPLDVDTTAMYWNTKFGAAPKTLADFAAAFDKAKAAGTASVGLCAGDGTWGSLPFITAVGGGAWGYQKDGITPNPSDVLVNSKAAVANIKKYFIGSNGKGTGFFAWDGWDGCGQKWLDGKAMAINTGSWRIAATKAAKIDFTLQAVPTIDGTGTSRAWAGFGGAFVTTYANDHGVALGAKRLMAWLATEDGALKYALALNRPPAFKGIASQVSAEARGIASTGNVVGALQENALLGDSTGGSNWYDVMGDAYKAIFTNGEDVQTTLDKAAKILSANFKSGFAKR